MIKVSELSGAQLDYWTARAEGIPAEQLSIRQIQRIDDTHCVRAFQNYGPTALALMYSTSWGQTGPLIDKYRIDLDHQHEGPVGAHIREWVGSWRYIAGDEGDTPLQAICRAVVRASFGDEVDEINITE